MQGLELSLPSLCAQEDLPPAHDLPLSPPTPPAPFHQFPEPESTYEHEGIRTAAGIGTHVGPQVLCTILPPNLAASLPSSPMLHSSGGELVINYSYYCNTKSISQQLQEQKVETTAASKLLQYRTYHLCVFMFVESVCHTTLYYRKRKQQEAAAGLQQPLRKHKKHKQHECQKCHQALSGNLKL